MEKLGIEGLKAVVGFSLSLGETIELLVNKNWTGAANKLMELFMRGKSAWEHKDVVWPQYKDIDQEEKTVLIEFVKSDFDLENDKAEEYVEKGLELAIKLSEVVKIIAGLFGK